MCNVLYNYFHINKFLHFVLIILHIYCQILSRSLRILF